MSKEIRLLLRELKYILTDMGFCKNELNVNIKGHNCHVLHKEKRCKNEDLRDKALKKITELKSKDNENNN